MYQKENASERKKYSTQIQVWGIIVKCIWNNFGIIYVQNQTIDIENYLPEEKQAIKLEKWKNDNPNTFHVKSGILFFLNNFLWKKLRPKLCQATNDIKKTTKTWEK